jgi:uncharacterized protein
MGLIPQHIIHEVINKIVSDYQPEKVYLFGSYAAGNPSTNSDIDLIVVKEVGEGMNRIKMGGDIRMSLENWVYPMDILVFSPKEFEEEIQNKFTFLGMAFKKSKLMYEKQ